MPTIEKQTAALEQEAKKDLANKLISKIKLLWFRRDINPAIYKNGPNQTIVSTSGHRFDENTFFNKENEEGAILLPSDQEKTRSLNNLDKQYFRNDDVTSVYDDREPGLGEATLRFLSSKDNSTSYFVFGFRDETKSENRSFSVKYVFLSLPSPESELFRMECFTNPSFLTIFFQNLKKYLGNDEITPDLHDLKTVFIAANPGLLKSIPGKQREYIYHIGQGSGTNFISYPFLTQVFTGRKYSLVSKHVTSTYELLLKRSVNKLDSSKEDATKQPQIDDQSFDSSLHSGGYDGISLVDEASEIFDYDPQHSAAKVSQEQQQKQLLLWQEQVDALRARLEDPEEQDKEALEAFLRQEAQDLGLSPSAIKVFEKKIEEKFLNKTSKLSSENNEMDSESESNVISPDLATQIKRTMERGYYFNDVFNLIKDTLGESLPAFTLWQGLLKRELRKGFSARYEVLNKTMDELDRLYDLVEKIGKKQVDKLEFGATKKEEEKAAFWQYATSIGSAAGGTAEDLLGLLFVGVVELDPEFVAAIRKLDQDS